MLRGYYTATAGMQAQQRRQEVLSNNLANAYTPGFKADQGTLRAFPELLIERMEKNQLPVKNGVNIPMSSRVGAINTGVYLQETVPNFAQGDIRETGMETDLALVHGNLPDETGALFYTLQNEAGEARYTRNGNFTVDGEGFLVSNQGYYVLDNEGNTIQTDGMNFKVNENGVLTTDGQAIPLGIGYGANALDFVKEGNGLYRNEGEAAVADARGIEGATFSVKQGFLEGSNVDPAQTMTEMMTSYRMFETNQKVLQAYDRSMEKAVNEIGRLR